jgi:GT2 family glycosyltransferase
VRIVTFRLMNKALNVSIVLYKSNINQIINIIELLGNSRSINNIYLIDNSPEITNSFSSYNVQYHFTGKNIGFGAGHNIALQNSINDGVKYHLVLNSDVSFDISVIEALIQKIDLDPNIGTIMPKILNSDGSVQLLPKLLPTPFQVLIRAIKPLRRVFFLNNNEYTLANYTEIEINVPIISGCFSLFRVEVIKEVGFYDTNFFMYFEDFDLSRRIHSKFKTIYYPKVSVIHTHERGAAKSFKLFTIFIKSAISYFNKYGWFFDRKRKIINKEVLDQII